MYIYIDIFLNWSTITLQCCAGFWCTTRWVSCKYKPPPLNLPPTPPSQASRPPRSTELTPHATQQLPSSFLFHTWSCTHANPTLSIRPPFPFLDPCVYLYVCLSVPDLQIGFICTIFWTPYHVLIYDSSFSLFDLLHSVWWSLGPSTSLQMTHFCSFLWLSNHKAVFLLSGPVTSARNPGII